jgi:hypothetical protein
MIDVHLVDDRQIEIALDDELRDMRGELRMAFDDRYGTRAPTFIGWLVFVGTTDCERQ